MLARARNNQTKSADANVCSFIEANITSVPIADGTADCIISNCVLNLVPESDKPSVFTEMARLLKPGGRVAISDTLARKPLPKEVSDSISLYVGCVAGASTQGEYERWLNASGFSGKYYDMNVPWNFLIAFRYRDNRHPK
jgi:arsenite methyltransferase